MLQYVELIMSVVSGGYGVCSLLQYVEHIMSVISGGYGVCSLLQYVELIKSGQWWLWCVLSTTVCGTYYVCGQ